jgi:hypothetical protein
VIDHVAGVVLVMLVSGVAWREDVITETDATVFGVDWSVHSSLVRIIQNSFP